MRLLWQQISSFEITSIYLQSEFDGVVFDCEHGNFDKERLFGLIQLVNNANKLSFVRFSELDKTTVRQVLDAGVSGVIFANVDSVEYSDEIINWCMYPPNGKRGQGLVKENGWGKSPSFLQNRNPIIVAQIESLKGVDCLPQISSKFDYYMIGPYDLTSDIGEVANWKNISYISCLNTFKSIIPSDKRAVHIVSNIESEYKSKFQNYGMVCLGMDTTFLVESVNNIEWLK